MFIAKANSGRFVSSVRQVKESDGRQVVTNELFRPGPDGRAVPGVPVPHDLADLLMEAGWDPAWHDRPEGWWR